MVDGRSVLLLRASLLSLGVGFLGAAPSFATDTPASAVEATTKDVVGEVRKLRENPQLGSLPPDMLRDLEKVAGSGDTSALVLLGELYGDGKLVPADPAKSFAAFEQAAQLDSIWGKIHLGRSYISGLGVDADVDRGLALIQEVAETGNGSALQALGELYSRGGPVPVVGDKALDYYQKAAAAGSDSAYVRIGELYRDGGAVSPDPSKAFAAFEQAAQLGNTWGKINLGRAYVSGLGVEADVGRGVALIEEVAATGNGSALQALGELYSRGGPVAVDGGKALDYYEKAAAAGSDSAYVRIGELYRDGGVVPADPRKAFAAFERAAQLGNAWGKIHLGRAYIGGLGVQPDVERGLSLIKEADIAAGWVMIGGYRSQGIVVEADRDAALEAYQKAADKGDVYALVRLAEAYRDGGLTDRDPERSIGLFQRAIDAGHVSARRILGESHLRGRFGARSSRDEGLTLLRQAQSLGDQSAPVTLANLYLYGTGVPKDVNRALELLAEAASGGNSSAAKTLISFYRDGRGRDVPKNLSKASAALSSSEGAFSPLDLMREKLLLSVASAQSSGRISAVLDEIRAAPPVIASPIIASLRHVNANAYVYFLQQELRDRGMYNGPINGLLTRQTIRAVGTLCSTSKTPGQCSYGPLHSRSANAVLKLLDGI